MKTFIRTALIAIAVFVGMSASAQDKPLTFGVKGGMNLSNFSGKASENSDAKIGFNVGVTVDYAFSSDVYLLTGLEFTTKGAKWEEGDEKLTLNPMYLQVPIHVGYKLTVAEDTRIVFHAGPYIAYGIAGKITAKKGSLKESENIFGSDEIQGLKRFDFGLGLGTAVEFGKFGIGLGYDFGLANIGRSSTFKLRNMNAYLTVGYKF